jgi:hypothetical protein
MSKARNLADVISGAFDVPAGALDNAVSSWDDLTGKPVYFTGRKNLIINGAMQITQRGPTYTGVSGSGYYAVDRFRHSISIGTWTISQTTDAPNGFGQSLKMDCTTAEASPGSTDALAFVQKIEGQDLQQLKKGTASAEQVTLSFWVKCTKTGTAQVNLVDEDNTRMIGQQFTISATNTWEQKTLTFAGDTTGALGNDNSSSLRVEIWLDAGSSYRSGATPTSWETLSSTDYFAGCDLNLGDSTSNDIYITGVQLELGDTATTFEHRSYPEELTLCQRYYYVLQDTANKYISSGEYVNTNELGTTVIYPVTMRSSPTLKQTTGTDYYYGYSGGYDWFNNWQAIDNNTRRSGYIYANTGQVSGTTGKAVKIGTGSGGFLAFSAEL